MGNIPERDMDTSTIAATMESMREDIDQTSKQVVSNTILLRDVQSAMNELRNTAAAFEKSTGEHLGILDKTTGAIVDLLAGEVVDIDDLTQAEIRQGGLVAEVHRVAEIIEETTPKLTKLYEASENGGIRAQVRWSPTQKVSLWVGLATVAGTVVVAVINLFAS